MQNSSLLTVAPKNTFANPEKNAYTHVPQMSHQMIAALAFCTTNQHFAALQTVEKPVFRGIWRIYWTQCMAM